MTRVERLIQVHDLMESEIDRELHQKFPAGTEVVFKYGNMTEHQNGVVEFADFISGRARIRVVNSRTKKRRDIPLTAILIGEDMHLDVKARNIYTTTRADRDLVKRMRKLGADDSEIAKSLGLPENAPVLAESRS